MKPVLRFGLGFLPIGLLLLLCLIFWRGLFLNPQELPSVHIGKLLPSFVVPQLLDKNKTFSPASLDHQVVLLNVWASWCEACVQEQGFLMHLAANHIPIYGLNYKDKRQDAKQWLGIWGNPYKLIGQDRTGKVGMDLGVYGAPETFIIDKQGVIRYRQVGPLTEADWKNTLQPLMRKLESQ